MTVTAIDGQPPHTATTRRAKIHPVDEVLPIAKLAAYGFQHVLAFYAGAVLVPIIIAGALNLSQADLIHLINADLFTCGIASLLQAVGIWKIGVRLPLLQGVTFTAVSPMIAIGLAEGGGTPGLLAIWIGNRCRDFYLPRRRLFREAGEVLPAGRHRLRHPDYRRCTATRCGQ
jgi:uric acid transporter